LRPETITLAPSRASSSAIARPIPFARLAREAGVANPDALSAQLVLLYDGSMVGAQLGHSAAPGDAARAAAAALVDAALRH